MKTYVIAEMDSADRPVRVVALVEASEAEASEYAAALCRTPLDKHVKRFRVIGSGLPAHLDRDEQGRIIAVR